MKTPTAQTETDRPRNNARRLLELVRHRRWALPGVMLLGVATSLAEGIGISLFVPLIASATDTSSSDSSWWFSLLSRAFSGESNRDRLLWLSLCVASAIFIKVLLSYLNTALNTWIAASTGVRLQSLIYRRLNSADYRYFEASRSGELIHTLATETWRCTDALGVLLQMLVAICSVVVYVTLLLLLSVRLTLIVLLCVVGISLLMRLVTRRSRALGQEVTRTSERLATRIVEGLAGMEVVRVFSQQEREEERFVQQADAVNSALIRRTLVSAVVAPLHEFLSAIVLLVVFAVTVQTGQGLPATLAFLFVLFRLQPRVRSLDESRALLRGYSASVDRVFGLLDQSGQAFPDGELEFSGLKRQIQLENVAFSYQAGQPVLKRLNAVIPAGRITAIIGPSGAGKSTFVKLLLGLYQPDQGNIRIDQQLLGDLRLQTWLDEVAFVGQRLYLFNESVRYNIAYGRPDATEQEVIDASIRADAHTFIERLPQGYETEVGNSGTRLSGGEQQRIALARAFLCKPSVLILDEATNSLDAMTEASVKNALQAREPGQTVIVIAHRQSTVEQADHILYLENGRIVEQGTPQELIAAVGEYFTWCETQQINGGVAPAEPA